LGCNRKWGQNKVSYEKGNAKGKSPVPAPEEVKAEIMLKLEKLVDQA